LWGGFSLRRTLVLPYPAAFTPGTLGRNMFDGPGMNWLQLGLAKTWVFRDRLRFSLRAEADNWPFNMPRLLLPNSVYNINNANLFGAFTSLRPPFAGAGQSRPQIIMGARIQF
jgi:hypothetical protein